MNGLMNECKNNEDSLAAGNINSAHRIKSTFCYRRCICKNIRIVDGKPLISKAGKTYRWKEYMENFMMEANLMIY